MRESSVVWTIKSSHRNSCKFEFEASVLLDHRKEAREWA
jgi:hypothetical protein